MNWKNATRDQSPDHLQVVLISVEGVYYITIYDMRKKLFRLKDNPEEVFDPEINTVYWTEFTEPDA